MRHIRLAPRCGSSTEAAGGGQLLLGVLAGGALRGASGGRPNELTPTSIDECYISPRRGVAIGAITLFRNAASDGEEQIIIRPVEAINKKQETTTSATVGWRRQLV